MLRSFFNRDVITTGLAIFSMFFGAGNLMFPLMVGLQSLDKTWWGMSGFLLTGVILPFAGLVAIVLFQGDYVAFFYRLGKIPGIFMILFWTSIAGPLVAMPRIVTLSYTMIFPFMPSMPLMVFSIIFLALTFIATYKESRIVDILGDVISPLLVASLLFIIIKGIISAPESLIAGKSSLNIFWDGLIAGYQTLDILGGILFSSVVITILQKKFSVSLVSDFNKLAWLCLKSGFIGVTILGGIYVGMSFIGSRFGHGLGYINEGELFSAVSFKILGQHGAAIIALAVMLACYSTIIALAAIHAEFLHNQVFKQRVNYMSSLLVSLGITFIFSNMGLAGILKFSWPIICVTYPSLITLTVCNILYKICGMRWIKTPVLLTLIISFIIYMQG